MGDLILITAVAAGISLLSLGGAVRETYHIIIIKCRAPD